MDKVEVLKIAMFTPGLNGRWGLPVLWWGKPGIGKSRVIEDATAGFGLRCTTLVASIREPADFGGLPVPLTQGKRTVMVYCAPGWALDAEIEGDGRGVVFVDEITTTAPATQAALLRMVLDGALGDYTFPAGVRFVAAANPVADAAGGWDLAPPLANRFGHLDWEMPAAPEWTDWLLGVNGTAPHEDTSPDAALEEQRVLSVWPGAFARAKGTVAAFVKARPDLLFKMPEVGSASRSKAWPSPRTWEMATRSFAGCMVHGAGEIVTDELIAAFVGNGAGSEFSTFRTKLDLPDAEHVLDGKVAFAHEPKRLDRTVAVLASCSALLCSAATPPPPRVAKLWTIVSDVMKDAADLVVPAARALVRKRLHVCPEGRAALVTLQPILEAAGVRP